METSASFEARSAPSSYPTPTQAVWQARVRPAHTQSCRARGDLRTASASVPKLRLRESR